MAEETFDEEAEGTGIVVGYSGEGVVLLQREMGGHHTRSQLSSCASGGLVRFPVTHTQVVIGTDDDGVEYTARFSIQRHVEGPRFLFHFDKSKAPSFSLGLDPRRARTIKGLETIAKLAPLHECPVTTGEPPRAASLVEAMIRAAPKNKPYVDNCAFRLRVSSGILAEIQKHWQTVEDMGQSTCRVIPSWLEKFRPVWLKQAQMAEQYVKGEIDDLTFFPVYARMKSRAG